MTTAQINNNIFATTVASEEQATDSRTEALNASIAGNRDTLKTGLERLANI